MKPTAKIEYSGALRTRATHLKSGQAIITDAPTDNNGKGEAFSPTDLLATALATCMLTVMGIKARSLGFDLEEATAEVTKIMESNPRRVGEVQVHISLKQNCDMATRAVLEKVATQCPVAQSISNGIRQEISFSWG